MNGGGIFCNNNDYRVLVSYYIVLNFYGEGQISILLINLVNIFHITMETKERKRKRKTETDLRLRERDRQRIREEN